MIDQSFFDARGQVRPDRVDEFVTNLRAKRAKDGRHILLTGPAGNAIAAQIARERAEAEKASYARQGHWHARHAMTKALAPAR